MLQLDPVRIALIAVAAVVVIGLIAILLRVIVLRRGKGRGRPKTHIAGGGRIAVLESREIDENRQLVLVRCDDVEHLIVIGGPADLVVENDVKKMRPQTPGTRAAPAHPLQPAAPAHSAANPPRVPPAMGASLDAAIAAAIPKASDSARAGSRPSAEPRPQLQPRPPLAAVTQRPAGRNGEALGAPLTPRSEEPARAAPRASAGDLIRREPAPQRRAAPQPAAQAARQSDTQRAQVSSDRQTRSSRSNAREESGKLPTAQVPWVEPASIEDEIVQALRFEPLRSEAPAARREPAPAKPIESSATLGDLADRLEEALAREIQGVAPSPRRAEQEAAEARAERATSESSDSERGKRSAARERQERRERAEPARQSASQSPETARETPPVERREEAPVISLNARRRETADPIEDEMARLLGELTGDTKGR